MKIGDTAYYYEHWSDSIVKCKIEELKEVNGISCAEVKDNGVVDLDGDIICRTYGHSTRMINDLYPTHSAAYDAYFKKCSENRLRYCNEIKNLSDLIRFPLEHCLNGEEYTNHDAVAAYKIKVKELLGIELDETKEDFMQNSVKNETEKALEVVENLKAWLPTAEERAWDEDTWRCIQEVKDILNGDIANYSFNKKNTELDENNQIIKNTCEEKEER